MTTLAFIPYPDLPAAGSGIGGFVGAVAAGVRNAACALYAQYPGFMANDVLNNPLGPFNRALWDSICPVPGGPTPPSLPGVPTIGQCPVRYDLIYNQKSSPGGTVQYNIVGGQYTGPLEQYSESSIGYAADSNGSQTWTVNVTIKEPNLAPRVIVLKTFAPRGGSYEPMKIHSQRFDGLETVCNAHNPDPYPRTVPPPGALSPTINVPVTPQLTIPIQLVFAPIVNNFQFQVKAGPFYFTFNMGGVQVKLDPTVNIPVYLPDPRTPPPVFPPADPPPGDVDFGPIFDELKRIDQKYNPLLDCNRCNVQYDFLSASYGAADSRDQNFPADAIAISVSLILATKPRKPKMQAGMSAPDVLYAGWFSWKIGDKQMPREPVHYDRNVYKAPDGATGFTYTVYVGFTATSSLSYKKVHV